MIHRAWEGERPRWVEFTEKATKTIHAPIPTYTAHLSPKFAGGAPARRSNIHRLHRLIDTGGLWLDCDVIPLTDLTAIRDEPWIGHAFGSWRPHVMFFPEPGHPLLVQTLELVERDPEQTLSTHLEAATSLSNTVVKEPRVVPHDARGTWALGNQQPLAVHLWFSSNNMDF